MAKGLKIYISAAQLRFLLCQNLGGCTPTLLTLPTRFPHPCLGIRKISHKTVRMYVHKTSITKKVFHIIYYLICNGIKQNPLFICTWFLQFSSLKNPIKQNGFLVYFELDFYKAYSENLQHLNIIKYDKRFSRFNVPEIMVSNWVSYNNINDFFSALWKNLQNDLILQ